MAEHSEGCNCHERWREALAEAARRRARRQAERDLLAARREAGLRSRNAERLRRARGNVDSSNTGEER